MFDQRRDEPNPVGHLLTSELGDLSDETPHGWEISEVVFAGCKHLFIYFFITIIKVL